jgi:hypothetical protein
MMTCLEEAVGIGNDRNVPFVPAKYVQRWSELSALVG